MKYKKVLNSSGDTIVEVLVVLAVLSLAFVTSYTIAIKALGQSRNAQEHSENLGNINSQTEWLRTAIAQKIALPVGKPFCMTSPTTFDEAFPPGFTINPVAAQDDFTKYPAACTQGLYYSSIVYSGDTAGNFDIKTRWAGAGSSGVQQEQLNYRTHELTADVSGGVSTTSSPAQITFVADKISPIAGPYGPDTPPCSNPPGLTHKGGTSVTLKLTDGTGTSDTKNTDSSSGIATFTNVVGSEFYTLVINSVPANYELCPSNSFPDTSNLSQLGNGEQRTINRKIRPICHIESGVGAPYAHYLGTYSDYIGTYGDYIGTYGDPYTVYWSTQGTDPWGNHAGRYHSLPTPYPGWYWGLGDQASFPPNSAGTYYLLWNSTGGSGTAYTAAYDHYSGAYDHYSAPYAHYSAPYGDPYTNSICPS